MTRLRLLTYLFIIVSGIVVALANAAEDELRAAIKDKFPNANIQSITEVPALGIYELVIDGTVYYSDAKFEHLIDGNIIEIKSMRNLTAERKREIEEAELRKVAMAFDDLPLANAFKKVYGDGSRRMGRPRQSHNRGCRVATDGR